jgi:hypothetical protein
MSSSEMTGSSTQVSGARRVWEPMVASCLIWH